MNWQWLLLMALLVYLGIDYGRMCYQQWKMKRNGELPFEIYTPVRYIFIGAGNGARVQELKRMDIEAHAQAGIDIKKQHYGRGYEKIIYDNKDEILYYCWGEAPIDALSARDIGSHKTKIFFDNELPQGAERACIKELGLNNYMVSIGICDRDYGGN